MNINSNFVIRNIMDTIILFPIKKNDISDDPIYINNVVYQILLNAHKSQNRDELREIIIGAFSLKDNESICQVELCIEQLITMGLIIEGDQNE